MEQPLQSAGQTQNVPAKKAWYKKWWVITIAVIIVLGAIGSSGEDKKVAEKQGDVSPEVSQSETKPAEPEKMTPEVKVTSTALAKEYSENEVAADGKYKGKIIEISGKVDSVSNGTFDNEIIVKLTDGQYGFSGPSCYMKPSEHDKVASYKKDQMVTLIGKGDSATIGSPVLKDCVVK